MDLELLYSNNAMLATLAKTRNENFVKDSIKPNVLNK